MTDAPARHGDLARAGPASGVEDRLVAWGRGRPDVDAIVLTSSRARSDGRADELSDHDVIVAVQDLGTFASSTAWQQELGTPIVRWGDEQPLLGRRTIFRGVIYDDGAKVDFTIWPRALLGAVADLDALPAELDMGYRVLLDDDGVTSRWPAPTFRAFVPTPPTAEEFRALVELFWWDVSYAAKALRRGELVFARSFMFEHEIRLEVFTTLLGWHVEIRHAWSLPLGTFGRQLDHHLEPPLMEELLSTYVGPTLEASWEALDRMCAMFRRVATGVAAALGFTYPVDVDRWMTAYVAELRDGERA